MAHVPGLVPWPEFARHVGAGLRPKSDTGGRGAAAGVESRLRNCACGCMARQSSYSGTALSGPGVASDHSTFQGVPQPRTKATFRGTVIMQVLVERRRNGVLDGSFYRVGRHSRTQPFSKARSAAPVIPWMAAQLTHSRTRSHAAQRPLPEGRMLPVLTVRMLAPRLCRRGIGGCQRDSY